MLGLNDQNHRTESIKCDLKNATCDAMNDVEKDVKLKIKWQKSQLFPFPSNRIVWTRSDNECVPFLMILCIVRWQHCSREITNSKRYSLLVDYVFFALLCMTTMLMPTLIWTTHSNHVIFWACIRLNFFFQFQTHTYSTRNTQQTNLNVSAEQFSDKTIMHILYSKIFFDYDSCVCICAWINQLEE